MSVTLNKKKMKTTWMLLLSICLYTAGFAQTKMIAHKSHSGLPADFSLEGDDNYGNPPMHMDTLIWLSDTSIVEIMSYGYGDTGRRDTVYNHPYFNRPGISLEEIQSMYPNYTVFIGFDKKAKEQRALPNQPKKNSLYLLGFLLFAFGGTYVFGKDLRLRKK